MRNNIDRIIGSFLALLMGIMTLDVLWGVLTRYAIGSQASWSEELARFLLIWIGLLGAAYVSGQNMHLAIELLKPKLSPTGQQRLATFIYILIMLFSLSVLVVGGIRLIFITQTLGQLSAALRLPMHIVYAVVPISGILIIYYALDDILNYSRRHKATHT